MGLFLPILLLQWVYSVIDDMRNNLAAEGILENNFFFSSPQFLSDLEDRFFFLMYFKLLGDPTPIRATFCRDIDQRDIEKCRAKSQVHFPWTSLARKFENTKHNNIQKLKWQL